MKKLKSKSIICLLVVFMSIPFLAHAATSYPLGGALVFTGHQNDTGVTSIVWDYANNYMGPNDDDKVSYAVTASVKVGSKVHTSGWRIGYASKTADRVWYANETAHYNYKKISYRKYTTSNWGAPY